MTETDQDDLSYVREMTEAGRNAPLLGGRFYVFFGALVTVAYTAQFLILSGRLGTGPETLGYLWISFAILVGVGMPLLLRSLKNKPGRGAVNNRVESVVWTTGGFCLFAYGVGTVIAQVAFGASALAWDFMAAVAFAAYGTGLMTTGTIAGIGWMRIPAVTAIGLVGVVPMLAGSPQLYAVGALGVFLVAFVPGVILMMGEPKAVPTETAEA